MASRLAYASTHGETHEPASRSAVIVRGRGALHKIVSYHRVHLVGLLLQVYRVHSVGLLRGTETAGV